jgi:nucleotide-binding universal stress UspA family protein
VSAFRLVVFPTDFSPPAQSALLHATALARKTGAALHVLHVVEDGESGPAGGLDSAVQHVRATAPEVDVQAVQREGEADEAILAYARTERASVVIMGTHGRAGIARTFLGSVTESVIAETPCPVLTVRADAAPPGALEEGGGRVLVPLDLDDGHSDLVQLCMAKTLAAEYGAALRPLHVFQDIDVPGTYGVVPNLLPDFSPDVTRRVEEELRRRVEAADGPETPDERVETRVVHGRPAQVIVDEAAPGDLIVIGTRSRGEIERLFLGSVAERVLRAARCPVLVVPPPRHLRDEMEEG